MGVVGDRRHCKLANDEACDPALKRGCWLLLCCGKDGRRRVRAVCRGANKMGQASDTAGRGCGLGAAAAGEESQAGQEGPDGLRVQGANGRPTGFIGEGGANCEAGMAGGHPSVRRPQLPHRAHSSTTPAAAAAAAAAW